MKEQALIQAAYTSSTHVAAFDYQKLEASFSDVEVIQILCAHGSLDLTLELGKGKVNMIAAFSLSSLTLQPANSAMTISIKEGLKWYLWSDVNKEAIALFKANHAYCRA